MHDSPPCDLRSSGNNHPLLQENRPYISRSIPRQHHERLGNYQVDGSQFHVGHWAIDEYYKHRKIKEWLKTYIGQDCRITGYNLAKGFESFSAHEDSRCIKSDDNNAENWVKRISQTLGGSNFLGKAVNALHFFLRTVTEMSMNLFHEYRIYPISNTSLDGSFQTSLKATFNLCPKA